MHSKKLPVSMRGRHAQAGVHLADVGPRNLLSLFQGRCSKSAAVTGVLRVHTH